MTKSVSIPTSFSGHVASVRSASEAILCRLKAMISKQVTRVMVGLTTTSSVPGGCQCDRETPSKAKASRTSAKHKFLPPSESVLCLNSLLSHRKFSRRGSKTAAMIIRDSCGVSGRSSSQGLLRAKVLPPGEEFRNLQTKSYEEELVSGLGSTSIHHQQKLKRPESSKVSRIQATERK